MTALPERSRQAQEPVVAVHVRRATSKGHATVGWRRMEDQTELSHVATRQVINPDPERGIGRRQMITSGITPRRKPLRRPRDD
jgi:hypothetical protein